MPETAASCSAELVAAAAAGDTAGSHRPQLSVMMRTPVTGASATIAFTTSAIVPAGLSM